MAASVKDLQEYNHYIQCHEAIHILCQKAVCPVVENVISNWHTTKQVILHKSRQPVTLQPCSSPQRCPASVRDNKRRGRALQNCPVYPTPCSSCEEWCHAIEKLYWTTWSFGAPVTWGNINPSRLFHDPIELAKAFAVGLPQGQNPTSFYDFDPACLLKIAMRFGECHRNNQQDHDFIQSVYKVRNNLCHKPLSDNMQLSLQERNQYFDAIFKLVDVLERLHPNYFPSVRANEIRYDLQNIPSQPTPEMEERATKQLTAETKQWLQSTVASLNTKQTKEICDEMEKQARQIEDTVSKDTSNIQTDVTEIKSNQMTREESEAILQSTLESSNRKQTTEMKKQIEDTMVAHTSQVGKVTSNIQAVLQSTLESSNRKQTTEMKKQIEDTMGAHTSQVGKVTSNIQAVLQSTLESSNRKQTIEMKKQIEDTMGAHTSQVGKVTSNIQSGYKQDIQSWRQRLQVMFKRERKQVSLGKGRRQIADMEDIFVDINILEEEVRGDKGQPKVKERREFISEQHEDKKRKKKQLTSYHEILTQSKLSKVALIHGDAGTGKTTLLSRIAYEWAKDVHVSSLEGEQKDASASEVDLCWSQWSQFDLLFLLDIGKLKPAQSLKEAVEEQLLPGVDCSLIQNVISSLGTRCLILLDGYDEMRSETLKSKDNAFDSPLLGHCFVVVTTRAHTVDRFCEMRISSGCTHFEITGFDAEKSFTYIDKFFDQSQLGDDLKVKLDATPALLLLSSIPILLLMICLLWRDNKGSLSNTVTSLYQNAIRYLNKPFTTGGRQCLDDKQVDEMLVELGKVAFDSLLKNQLHMDKKTFGNDQMLEQAFQMGLCSQEDTGLVDGTLVSFVHKTFQEYCAAKYLTALFEESRESFAAHARLKDICMPNTISAFEFVLRFCCGMHRCSIDVVLPLVAKATTHGLHTRKMRLHHKKIGWRISLLLLYEADVTFCDLDLPSLNSHLMSINTEVAKLDIGSSDAMEALMHFTSIESGPKNEWLSRISHINVIWLQIHIDTIMRLLRSMASLAKMTLTYVLILGELDPRQAQPCQSLNEMRIDGGQIKVQTLVRFLGYLKSLRVLDLKSVVFKGELKGILPVVCPVRKLRIFYPSFHEVRSEISSNTMTYLLACMPHLSQLHLKDVTIDRVLDTNIPIQLKNLDKFKLKRSKIDASTLMTYMKSMDQHVSIEMDLVHLVGTLSLHVQKAHPGYLKVAPPNCFHFTKGNCHGRVIDVDIFMSFINTVTSLSFEQNPVSREKIEESRFQKNCVEMHNMDFDSSKTSTPCHSEPLLKSVKCLNMSFDSIGAESFMKFLRSMPSLYCINIESVHIVGELDSKASSPVCIQSVEYVRLHLLSVSPDTLKTIMMCFPSVNKFQLICPNAVCISHCASVLPQSLELLELACEESEVIQSRAIVRCLESKPVLNKLSLWSLNIEGNIQECMPVECRCLKTFSVEQCTVNATTLLRFLQCMTTLESVILKCNTIKGDLNFDSYEVHPICNSVISCNFINTVVNFSTVLQILCNMPSLQNVALVKVIDEEGVNNFPILKCVKKFILVDATVNVLMKILRCIPAVETIGVMSAFVNTDCEFFEPGMHFRWVDVMGDILQTVPDLCKRVTRIFFSECSLSLITVLKMISSMSCVTDVHFNSSLLIQDETIPCTVLKYLSIYFQRVSANTVKRFLSAMPNIVSLELWKITGEVDCNAAEIQLRYLKKLRISGCNNATYLRGLLQVMPHLQELYGLDCTLMSSMTVDLSEPCFSSVKSIEIIGSRQEGCLKAGTLLVVVGWFPLLEEVQLVDGFWINDLNADVHFKLIKNFSIILRSLSWITLFGWELRDEEEKLRLERGRKLLSLKEAFGCFQSLEKVTLDGVELSSELDAEGMNDTLKEFRLEGTSICFQTLVKFINWLKNLQKMEAVELSVSGELDPNAVVSCQSLHELDLGIKNHVKAASVMNFLCCFPALQKLRLRLPVCILQDIPDCDIRWQSLSELTLCSSNSNKKSIIDVNAVLRLLTLMPVLYKLLFKSVCLRRGEVDVVLAKQVRSSSRISMLDMADVEVDEILLRQVIGYLPSLQTIRVVVDE